jgi:WW domain-binding protein 4
MSEYWVSKKKYFCTYCDIFIADDVPSRTHHENGMRHQGNKERFVKGLYKAGEKKKKEEEEERREMKNVDAAAMRAYALDVGAGRAGIGGSGSGSSLPGPKAPPPPPKKPSNPYTNYTTAEFLGYKDPDAERIQAELERKRSQGAVGDWEPVPTAHSFVAPAPSGTILDVPQNLKPHPEGDAAVVAGTKREAEALAVDDEDGRAWKLRKKTAQLTEIYDPGVIPIKLKAKKEEVGEAGIAGSGSDAASMNVIVPAVGMGSKATNVPTWIKVEWKKPGDSNYTSAAADQSIHTEPTPSSQVQHCPSLAREGASNLSKPLPLPPAPKTEPSPVELEDPSPSDLPSGGGSNGSLFKRRKGKPSVGSAALDKRDKF